METAEGRVGCNEQQDCIVYPRVTSCMTITCIFPERRLVGGHCVKVPSAGQLASSQIATEMARLSEGLGQGMRICFVGQLSCWSGEEKEEVYKTLEAYENVFALDTIQWPSVDVQFSADGVLTVVQNPDKEGVHSKQLL